MIRSELRFPGLLLSVSVCALLAASCESIKRVGSDCRDGVCPKANTGTAPGCVLSATTAEVAIQRISNDDPEGAPTKVCLPRRLPTNSRGQVACRVLWRLGDAVSLPGAPPPSPEQCSDLPFLEPAGGSHPANACVVKQLTAEEVAAGEVDGWYYAEDPSQACANVGAGDAVQFTAGAQPPSGVVVDIACSRVQAASAEGELVDVDAIACGELPEASPEDVGTACLPSATPEGGYVDSESYVQTSSDQCDTEACLVYRMRGFPNSQCDELGDGGVCATERSTEQRAYCSCRCDGPAGDPGPLCECADGFSCLDVFPDGPPGVRGSYCVRDGTFTGSE